MQRIVIEIEDLDDEQCSTRLHIDKQGDATQSEREKAAILAAHLVGFLKEFLEVQSKDGCVGCAAGNNMDESRTAAKLDYDIQRAGGVDFTNAPEA